MFKGWARLNGDDWTRPELPHDHSSQLVEHTMNKVGIIIAKCQKKFVTTQPDLSIKSNFDFIIDEQIGKNIYIDIRDIMRKMMVTNSSRESAPDSLMSALDSVVCSLHCCDVKKDTEELDVKRTPAPTYSSRAHSRARSRSF